MARIRTIKPEFFTSEDIVSLSPFARLLYIGLWCEADREGRLSWKPRTFKMRYLPADDCDISALAGELLQSGLVVLYGDGLAYIPSFTSHQHVNPREAKSELPEPKSDASSTRRARVTDGESTVSDTQVGKEGKGREGREDASGDATRKRAPSKTALPQGFTISDRVRSWAAEKGHARLEQHLESFRAKATAKGYTYADWDSAFMEAIRENWAKLPPDTGNVVPMEQRPGGGRRAL
ncbi:hypothetical protein [Pseudoxanthomonas sp. USHLN014]|uniref:hypothetical protein n=1 Tax=Pseudoxanthomonas sp. USHLN014 TaxID=3081297 RepID=UPI00301D2F8B